MTEQNILWQQNFNDGVEELQEQFNSFFIEKPLIAFYEFKVDNLTQTLHLEITPEGLPIEFVDKLIKLFTDTKPENVE